MKTSTFALAASLTLAGPVWLAAAPAEAQSIRQAERQRQEDARRRQQQPDAPQSGRVQGQGGQQLSAEEGALIRPLLEAVRAQNWAAATAALPAAQAGVQSPYGKYVVGQLQYEIGGGTQNTQLQSQAVDTMLASGGVPAEAIRSLLNNQVAFAVRANNYAAAEAPLVRLIELDPNSTERLTQLAEVKIHLNKRPEALELYRRIAAIHQGNNQPVPENVSQRILALAAGAGQTGEALALSLRLLETSPSPENWRNAIILYRQSARPQETLALDLRRFMRAAGLITESNDYLAIADSAIRGGLLGEAKAVLDEGVARGVLNASDREVRELMTSANSRIEGDRASLAQFRTRALAAADGRQARSTGDAYYGYGQFAEAAELYRAAIQKGGVDANLVNLRLGAALAQAGQRAEAETALRAVTGPQAAIARFWQLWLARRT